MLATGEVEVHGPQEAVGRIVERPAERGTGRLDQHLAQRRGHALRAEGTAEHRRHRGENTARIDVPRRFTAPLRAAGPVRSANVRSAGKTDLMTTAIAPRRLRRTVLAGAMLTGTVLAAVMPTAASAAVLSTQLTDGSIAPAVSSSSIKLTPIASGLSSPVLITSARDGTGRLFIVEQTGTIRVYTGGNVLSTPLLNISSSVSKGSEQGLLGLAFHPNFKNNHKFYVDYTNTSGNTVVREYRTSTSNPNRVAAGSGRTLLHVNQPYANHNGGNLAFGPDGLLYIGMGDGGDGGDPGNRAQSKNTLLGKMLRINVNARLGIQGLRGSPGRTRTSARPGATRSTSAASATRGGSRSTARPAGSGSATSARSATRRSTAAAAPGPTGAGARWRATTATTRRRAATRRARRCRCSNYTHANGRCAVTGGYVYRGSDDPGAAGLVRVRRLLQRRDLDDPGERRRARDEDAAAQHERPDQLVRRERRRRAVRGRRSAARSTGSTTPDPGSTIRA